MKFPSSSQAVRYHEYGQPHEVVACEEVPLAAVDGKEVLVRMLAAPVNPSDLNMLEGKYGRLRALPDTPGNEGVGIVEETGRGVDDISPGNLVLVSSCSWREWGVWPRVAVNRIPTGLDSWQAAMLRINPATAWAMLNDVASLHADEWVVQNAGTSMVARSVSSILKRHGVKLVTFVRRPESISDLKAVGFEHLFEDSDSGFQEAKELLGGANAALALNAVGGESASRLFKLLREDAGLITYGAMGRQPVKIPNAGLLFGERWVRGFWLTRWLERQERERIRGMYRELAELSLNEELVFPVASVYPLGEVQEAVRDAGRSGRSGKVLLRMDGDKNLE